ncbi:MAG: DNA repair protein RecN [Christensenellales bacterium]|jgi:DNA repair protein RecN (Recombination protein N)
MLRSLHIENIALIDRLDLDLPEGMVVLTGETGAGKSIIIDSVSLLLGGRADRDLIKSGAEKAVAQGLFDLDERALPLLHELGIPAEDGELVLSRELSLSGRNTCRINGRIVPLSALRAIGSSLVDIHGQHDHQALLDPEKHLDFLDGFAAKELSPLKDEVARCYAQWKEVVEAVKAGTGSEAELARREDMLRYQMQEISSVNPVIGEEEELTEESRLLSRAEDIKNALSTAVCLLNGGDEDERGALALLQLAAERLGEIAGIAPKYANLKERLDEACYAVEDATIELRSLREDVPDDPYRLEEVNLRLDKLYQLKRKYGSTIDEVIAYKEQAEKELLEMEDKRALLKRGEEEITRLRKQLYESSKKLSMARRKAAKELETAILREMGQLGMEKAAFEIRFAALSDMEDARFSENGMDSAEMLLSTNPGEPVRPLHKVASGGELSRIMLAFKSIECGVFHRACMIFDEIDTGISGRISTVVGQKMRALSAGRQVLCVTHSAQIAAMANCHLLIEKMEKRGRTVTSVRVLSKEERELELARIISGAQPGKSALAHAKELLKTGGR